MLRDKPLTMGQLNSMQRITPTGAAEELYQSRLKQNQALPVGPAGIEVPPSGMLFRKTKDGDILRKIAAAAYREWAAREITSSAWAEAAVRVRQDLLARYPEADMLVLKRYRFASLVDEVRVTFATEDPQRAATLRIDEILLPTGVRTMQVDMGGRTDVSALRAPQSVEPFFRQVIDVRRAKSQFDAIANWPRAYQERTARMPRWGEIEREHPEIGRWLAEQRKGLAA